MLGSVLDPGRHQLEFCGGSAEAIKRVREHVIDVVVTDAATSVNEDLALVGELHEVRPGVKMIVLAPAASQADVVEAIRANVFASFTHPLDYAEVASMARTALGASDWHDAIQVTSGLPHWLAVSGGGDASLGVARARERAIH
jgi:DNA-binding NtrC family response regulator